MMLNYDLTCLALVLTGLYEPETLTAMHRCIPHPVHRHPMAENEAIDYAADMCVLLSYQKLMDDWKDERRYSCRALAGLMKSGYHKLGTKYPRQVQAVEENIRLLHEAEQRREKDIDYVSGLTGAFLSEIYVWKEDIWQEELRRMGFYIGKFIYLMDALEDVEKDRRHGSYNLFADCGEIWGNAEEERIRDMLTGMMTEAARSFERLPILENAEIIRNILYSGVWCRYAALKGKHSRKEDPSQKQI
jgi:hypothetical protein